MSSTVKSILIKTTPFDKKHFPATNQQHYCWQKYNEFVLCMKKNDSDDEVCADSRQLAISVCPEEWYSVWDEQRENGNFLGVLEKPIVEEEHDE